VLAILGSFGFAGIVAWLHVIRRDIDPGTQGVSHYAVGSSALAMTVAFAALALSLAATALSLTGARELADKQLGLFLVWLASFGIGVVAAVPVPGAVAAAWRGPVHTSAALLFFVAVAGGAVLVSGAIGPKVTLLARLLAIIVILFLLSMARTPGLFRFRGWFQRCCFVLVVAWVVFVAVEFRLAR
jgi:Protein of unknown function (DUF998)